MKFFSDKYDYGLSPYTGLTREVWIDAGKFLIDGIFGNVKSFEDPIIVKRTEHEISYPHSDVSLAELDCERKAERFEGLVRSLFIAGPLIAENPSLTSHGYVLKDYYKTHILNSCTRENKECVGWYGDLKKSTDKFCFQQTVETGALVIGLYITEKYIWDTYTEEEKDVIASFISEYAHGDTINQNWQFFNMLGLAFLDMHGYKIDHDIMVDHAQSVLNYYVGGGWYRDGHYFDYYSCWGFQFYAPLWNVWYGYDKLPYVAKKFEVYSNELMKTFPLFFDRDGFVNLWGRSAIYRFGVLSAFYGNAILKNNNADYGLFRRIASGCLMQFLSREDFIGENGIPTLGFYREFTPLIQRYSCAESVFWLGKAFMLLTLSKDHPFWNEKEKENVFEKTDKGKINAVVNNGAGLALSNHPLNGETVLRTGKVVLQKNDKKGMWLYGRLSYNTSYPVNSSDCDEYECEQYVLKNADDAVFQKANVILWSGERDGVLYRKALFDYDMTRSFHWVQSIYLADFPVSYGIFRADKIKFYKRPVVICLSSYGFPDNGTEIIKKTCGNDTAVIFKGRDGAGREKQLAATFFGGWDKIDVVESKNTNPDSEKSLVICATQEKKKQYGYENYLLMSQTITKDCHDDFSDDELFSVKNVISEDDKRYSAYGKTVIQFKDGRDVIVDFTGIEANLQL